jgi:hypothetical protein
LLGHIENFSDPAGRTHPYTIAEIRSRAAPGRWSQKFLKDFGRFGLSPKVGARQRPTKRAFREKSIAF